MPTPFSTSIVKQMSPAKPNINEYGSSLTPTVILSEKLYDFISFITSFYSLRSANKTAFFVSSSTISGNAFWMLGAIKAYALPLMPWQRPKPFFNTPYSQIYCKLFNMAWGIPNLIAYSGNMFIKRASALTMPGAPWQKCTNFILCDPADVEKFPLIKCFNKNSTDFEISRQYIDSCSIGNWFSSNDSNKILILPPSPWAPPKYSFLWNK